MEAHFIWLYAVEGDWFFQVKMDYALKEDNTMASRIHDGKIRDVFPASRSTSESENVWFFLLF